MIHYNVHVAEVLQPIGHSRNPYRSIYLSTALEGMAYHQSGVKTPGGKAYLALAQSLTASSAFHLWNHDKRQGRYRVLGLKHRFLAMRSLQEAVQGAALTDHYGALMTAVLSLITIGVMSGEGDDFRAHIDAATQLRNMCGQADRLDGASRQLNEIGAFLSLLARTLTFGEWQAPPPGYGDDRTSAEEDIIRSSTCYEYVYGITPAIATAISQTCQLAENLARFQAEKEGGPLPEDFVETCEQLGNQLYAWRFESETNTSISLSDGVLHSILTHIAKAWHGAALVYYLVRMRGTKAVDLVEQVNNVAEQLHAAEDLKSKLESKQHRQSMSPITWPGFVGACSAVPCRRATWRRWWEGIQRYGIASNEKQWQVVQQVWERMDSEERERSRPIDWTEAFVSLGIEMLPS